MSPRVISVREPSREGTGAWSWPASLIRICGVALLVVAVIAVLRFFGRIPSARPVEDFIDVFFRTGL